MCAIDANVRDQVFGDSQPAVGEYLFNQLNSEKNKLRLVVGGKFLQELSKSRAFNTWLQTALLFGRAQSIADEDVETATQALRNQGSCLSDDENVLALAQVSRARLLYTNDRALQRDFKNRQIVSGVQGRVYTTLRSEHVTRTHRGLLRRTDLCGI